MQRKIIQLATIAEGDMTKAHLFALCDDGSALTLQTDGKAWKELPPIPQKPVERNFIGQNQIENDHHYREGFNVGCKGMPSDAPLFPESDFRNYMLGYKAGLEKTKL